MKLNVILLPLFLLFINPSDAQMIVAVDSMNFDFYGYNLSTNEFTDFRIDTTSGNSDKYLSIAKLNNNIAFIGLIKQTDSGIRQPMIIKYNFHDKSYNEIIVNELEFPAVIAIDHLNHKIYWIDTKLNEIRRANYDGTGLEVYFAMFELFRTDRKPALGIDDDDRLWATNSGPQIAASDILDWPDISFAHFTSDFNENPGSGHNGSLIGDIIVDYEEPYFYWSNNTNETPPNIVKRKRGTGSGWGQELIVISEGTEQFFELALYGDRIYWTDQRSVVFSANKSGNDIKQELESNRSINDLIVRSPVSTSIIEAEESVLFNVSPNPASNYIDVSDLPIRFKKYSIIDSYGLAYDKERIMASTKKINVDRLSPGLYFIIANDDEGNSVNSKFIKY